MMTKFMNRIIVILLFFILILFTNCGISYGFKLKAKTDKELANDLKKNPEDYLKLGDKELNKLISSGKQLKLYVGKNSEDATVSNRNAMCMWHKQAYKKDAEAYYTISNILKVDGNNLTIYTGKKKKEYNRDVIGKFGCELYHCITDSKKDKEDEAKARVYTLWFKSKGVKNICYNYLSKPWRRIDKRQYNYGIVPSDSYKYKYVKPKKAVTATPVHLLGEGEQQYKTEDGEQCYYLGPFKVKNYKKVGGTKAKLMFKCADKEAISKDVYVNNNGNFEKYKKGIPNDRSFYIRIINKNNASGNWELSVELPIEKYQAIIFLLYVPTQDDQELLEWGADKVKENVPIIWNHTASKAGSLEIVKRDGETEDLLPGTTFQIKGQSEDGKVIYDTTKVTGSDGKIILTDLPFGEYTITEKGVSDANKYVVDSENTKTVQISDSDGETVTFYNEPFGKLKIYKKDKDTGQTIKDAKVRVTGFDYDKTFTITNGYLEISHLPVGHYTVEEIKAPNGYDLSAQSDSDKKHYVNVVSLNDTDWEAKNTVVINNKRTVSISGFVWLDSQTGKASIRSDGYNKNSGDRGINGIKVKLVDNNGKVIQSQTTTNKINNYPNIDGGEFQFNKVDYSALGKYHIEYDYCGIEYQAVVINNINKDNESKASETASRANLNKKFSKIDGNSDTLKTGSNNSQILNVDGINFTYSSINNNKSTLRSHDHYNVQASTALPPFALQKHVTIENGISVIKNVNLGLYQKPSADIAIGQDLISVKTSINESYYQIYTNEYGKRAMTYDVEKRKANSDYNKGYNRAIYKEDYYFSDGGSSKELQMYLTYKIVLKNQSPYNIKINNILEYYNNDFELNSVGTNLYDDNNTISNDLSNRQESEYNETYKKLSISTNINLSANNQNTIYVQFKVRNNNESKIKLNADFYPVAEINSYTALYNGNYVAVVDQDSVPGNMIPGNGSTYEDDTDAAPPVQFILGGTRTITGSVFLDNPISSDGTNLNDALNAGKERKGNGIYDVDSEIGINDVEVVLQYTEDNGQNWEVADVYDEDQKKFKKSTSKTRNGTDGKAGTYTISGFIPGKYRIVYIWGGQTYVQDDGTSKLITVQDYKGTVYNNDRKANYDDNGNHMYWDKEDVDKRYQDAIDDYELRKKIDEETIKITDGTIDEKIRYAYTYKSEHGSDLPDSSDNKITKTAMRSLTPMMEIYVEKDGADTDSSHFEINNIDFGIIKRPVQHLGITKRVSEFKLTLTNGQVLVDATVNPNGEFDGAHNYTTIMPGVFIKAEADNEIIQGATLEVKYSAQLKNESEIDYRTKDYYIYGIVPRDKDNSLVEIKTSELVDFLDGKYVFNKEKSNLTWTVATKDDFDATKNVSNAISKYPDLEDRTILRTDLRTEDGSIIGSLKPGKSINNAAFKNMITASKLLSTSETTSFKNTIGVTKVEKQINENESEQLFEHVGAPIRDLPYANAEIAEVAPSTGRNKNYTLPIIIGITVLTTLGIGIFSIKKFLFDK